MVQTFIYQIENKTNKTSVKWIVSFNQLIAKSLHKSKLTVIIYFTGLLFLFESCAFTWIGRSIGGDIGKPNFNDYSDTRIIKVSAEKINYGGKNHIEVHKTDSSVLTGIFRGLTTIPSEKYNPDYNLPAFDSVSQLANLNLPGELLLASISNNSGFGIEDSIEPSYPYIIGFRNRNSSYALSPDLATCMYNSKAIKKELEKSSNLIESNSISIRNGVIILNDKHQKMIIPAGEIAYVRCQRGERNGKRLGAAIGAIFDIAAMILKSKENMTEIKSVIDF